MTAPLIHIGYHKTGTTWLQDCLFVSERCGFTAPFQREDEIGDLLIYRNSLDFSSLDSKEHFYPPLEGAMTAGLTPVISYERLSGDPHSGGYDSKEIANRLFDVFPTARILIVIREQKSMIISAYKQYVIEGGPCRPKKYLLPTHHGKGRLPFFSFDYFKYDRLIKHYIQLFGADNVRVLPYELLRSKPKEFIESITAFAQAKVDREYIEQLTIARSRNVSLSARAISIKRILNFLFADDRLNPGALVPSAKCERMCTWYLKKLDSRMPRSPKDASEDQLKKEICGLIGERYKTSNQNTSQLSGIDLGFYGYAI